MEKFELDLDLEVVELDEDASAVLCLSCSGCSDED